MDQLSKTRRGLSALLPSRKHFDVLAQELPIGVYELDADARFVYVNERWSELTGVDHDSAVGEEWASVVHPEDLDRVGSEWFRSLAEDRPFSLEFRYVRADGSPVWIWCRVCSRSTPTVHSTNVVTVSRRGRVSWFVTRSSESFTLV